MSLSSCSDRCRTCIREEREREGERERERERLPVSTLSHKPPTAPTVTPPPPSSCAFHPIAPIFSFFLFYLCSPPGGCRGFRQIASSWLLAAALRHHLSAAPLLMSHVRPPHLLLLLLVQPSVETLWRELISLLLPTQI